MNDSLIVRNAFSVARSAHAEQTRRDGVTPYFRHVGEVAVRVRSNGGSEEAIAVAYLHDVLEDTQVTQENLEHAGFPAIVVEAVVAMTKREGEPYEDYLQRVRANPLAAKVKVYDMLANLSDDPTGAQIVKYSKALLFLLSV